MEYVHYPPSWDFPPVRDPRTCLVRMVDRQVDLMRSRGWPVQDPFIRVTPDPDIVFFIQNEAVLGATFHIPADGEWHVILPAGTERELCRQETRLRARMLPDMTLGIDTVFHELTHQFIRNEIRTEWRAIKLRGHFMRWARTQQVKLGPVTRFH